MLEIQVEFATCNLSPVTCEMKPATCHLSPVACHLSHITRQMSVTSKATATHPSYVNSPHYAQ